MKSMVFQVEDLPNGAADSREIAALLQVIRAGAADAEAQIAIDRDGDHLNITIDLIDPLSFWAAIKPNLDFTGTPAIVVCEGEHGWDDYVLLHHHDRNQAHGHE